MSFLTILTILADLNYAIVLLVSVRPLISNSSTDPFQSFWGPLRAHQLHLVSPSWLSLNTCLFFSFSLVDSASCLSIFD